MCAVFVSLNSCANRTISKMEKKKVQDESSLTFSSKKDILEWGENKYGFSGDFDEISHGEKDYFIFYGYLGHGIISTNIYVFSRKGTLDSNWEFELKKFTEKSNLNAFCNEGENKIVVAATDGEILLIIP